ncbi:MAG TPA: 1-acyl-sn-glycerol-3-phosphate acyltransferase, partial [Flavilitoribacter sp.]|nr:1-acyl-sn-glycerol-3-phosphate acyltransferase [Flavilitoribacter sp.]
FKKIDLIRKERIPGQGPVIFAANHPTAFIDHALLACFQSRNLQFLTRGDYYTNPVNTFLLGLGHIRPVYRIHESGFTMAKTNLKSFAGYFMPGKEKEALMVSVEGYTTHEKRLRPVRKGAARIAFETLEAGTAAEVHIVPVGLNYTYADRFRSQAMVVFDEPIRASDYMGLLHENKAKAVNALTEEIKKRLEANVIIIRKDREEVAEAFFTLYRSDHPRASRPVVTGFQEQLWAEKAIADGVNAMDDRTYEEWNELQKYYFSTLERAGLQDETLVRRNVKTFSNRLKLILGFLPATAGCLWSLPPFWLGKRMSAKMKRRSFVSSVRLGVSLGTLIGYSLIWGVIAWFLSGIWAAIWVPLLPAAAWFSIPYRELRESWRQDSRLNRLPLQEHAGLMISREQLLAGLKPLLPPESPRAAVRKL